MNIKITDKGFLEIFSYEKNKSVNLKERSLINQVRIPKTYSASVIENKEGYLYYIDLSSIDLYDNQIFDLIIDEKEYSTNRIIKEVKFIDNTNYKCFLYRNKKGTISLKVESDLKYVDIILEKNDEDILEFNISHCKLINYNIDLIMKKRVRNDLELYCDEIYIEKDVEFTNKLYLNKNNIYIEKLSDNDQWDFYFRINENNKYRDIGIRVINDLQDEFKINKLNSLFISKFITINSRLSIIFMRSDVEPIKELNIRVGDKISIELIEDKNYKVISCYLKPRQNNNIKFSNLTSIKYELSSSDNLYFINDEVTNRLLLPFNIIVWDYYCSILNLQTGKVTDIMLRTNKVIDKSAIKIKNYKFEHYRTDIKTLALRVSKIESKYNKIKIGVLGSCFSRSAFQSTEFFNLDYKDKYEVIFTSFHTAISSIISKPKSFTQEYVGKASSFQKRTIENDFNKGFFSNLKNSDIDFLIIDLYADAVRPLLVYEDGSMITDSYMLRNTEYIYRLENPKVFNYNNLNEYIKLWENSFEKFAKKLEENFDTSKIIFQRARTALKIKNCDGKVENFNSIEVLESRIANSLFEYMELHFINRFPKCEVIDIIKKNYVAVIDHPEGRSVSHYESEYYKEFMHQLDKIVINKLKS